MAEAHGAGIVHRDLKPANLFLAEDNGERIVKVLDFGISKVVGETTMLTSSGAVMGTVLYMSPEQVRATPDVDTRADIWALGVILYELVAGRAPWEGSSHQIAAAIVSADAVDVRTFAAVPDGLATALRTALARDRNHRFGSVRDLAGALVPFTSTSSLGAAVADQLVSGHSSPRMRPAYASFSSASLPPSLPPMSSPHPSLVRPAPAATAPPSGNTRASAFVAVGALLGVLAAVGIVLGFVAIGARRQTAVRAESPPAPAPAPSAEAPPLIAPEIAPEIASVTAVPSSPSTGLPGPATSASVKRPQAAPPTTRPAGTLGGAATATATATTPASASAPPPFL
jgi:serine/threonine-protein kinase